MSGFHPESCHCAECINSTLVSVNNASSRTYSQAEADALIARALTIGEKELLRKMAQAMFAVHRRLEFYTQQEANSPSNHQEFARQAEEELNAFNAALVTYNEWALKDRAQEKPDAARLALEEREAAKDKLWMAALGYRDAGRRIGSIDEMEQLVQKSPFVNDVRMAMKDRFASETTAREAKLIADTRLEEAEWWANGHHSAKRQLAGCPQCERLAAHRAAVQEGKDDIQR